LTKLQTVKRCGELFRDSVERCNPWPHVANYHISISQLLSLWRHSHYDVIHYWSGHARGARVWCVTRSRPIQCYVRINGNRCESRRHCV